MIILLVTSFVWRLINKPCKHTVGVPPAIQSVQKVLSYLCNLLIASCVSLYREPRDQKLMQIMQEIKIQKHLGGLCSRQSTNPPPKVRICVNIRHACCNLSSFTPSLSKRITQTLPSPWAWLPAGFHCIKSQTVVNKMALGLQNSVVGGTACHWSAKCIWSPLL